MPDRRPAGATGCSRVGLSGRCWPLAESKFGNRLVLDGLELRPRAFDAVPTAMAAATSGARTAGSRGPARGIRWHLSARGRRLSPLLRRQVAPLTVTSGSKVRLGGHHRASTLQYRISAASARPSAVAPTQKVLVSASRAARRRRTAT